MRTARSCSTASWQGCAGSGRSSSPRTTRSESRRCRPGGWLLPRHRLRCRSKEAVAALPSRPLRYLGDTAVLARKDLRLELRARDTLPAMLLFVLAIFVVFHFALPSGSSRLAELGLLWVAIVFTALLGLREARRARRQSLLDALVLAPCDRSAIWLAKGIATF